MDVEGKSAHGVLEDPDETVSAQNSASVPDPMDNQGNGFLNLLGVDVVVEELLQYLSVEDLLDLSSVSKDALIAVRKSKVFSKRVKFRISNKSLCSRVLDNCFHSWKTVEFDSFTLNHKLEGHIPNSTTISQSLDSVQSFSVELDYPTNRKVSVRSKIIEFVQKIVESSKETLKDLELCLPSGGFDGIESIKCPNLKKLSLFVDESTDDQLVEEFLKKQPPLEDLTIDGVCPSHLITGLQGRMFKLRKLEIGLSKVSHDRSTSPPPTTDWSLVEGMTKLEDLNVDLYSDCYKRSVQGIEEILGRIPAEALTKIWISVFTKRKRSFSQRLGEHISRFNNLTELALWCDLTNFFDDSLQSIIKGCPKLIKLTLMTLEKVTDFGFSGVKKTSTGDDAFHFASNERGVALTDLKDLTKLTIRHDGILSLATLLEVIRFQFLASLYFAVTVPSWQAVTPKQFLLQILQQNPSLIKIEMKIGNCNGHGFLYQDNPLEDEVKTLYPRIQQLKFEYDPEYSGDDGSESD